MRILAIIICALAIQSLKAQPAKEAVLELLNADFQAEVAHTIDTMFKGQDTIFTETDSFILYTTPDMVIPDLDTAAYRFLEGTAQSWDYDQDGTKELVAIAYLSDKRDGSPLQGQKPQYLTIARTEGGDSLSLAYFSPLALCPQCGMAGRLPSISIIARKGKIELMEAGGRGDSIILNRETYLHPEEGKMLIDKEIVGTYYSRTENMFVTETDWGKLLRKREYESPSGESLTQRIAIAPAILSRPISLDGQLTEATWQSDNRWFWRPLPVNLGVEKHTMNDLFAKYAAAWRKGQLYLALKVKDDLLVPLTGNGGDFVKLTLAPQNRIMEAGKRRETARENQHRWRIGFNAKGEPQIQALGQGRDSLELQAAFFRTEDGYHLELQIEGLELRKGQELGASLQVSDSDDRGTGFIENSNASTRLGDGSPFYLGLIKLYDRHGLPDLSEERQRQARQQPTAE